MKKLIIALIIAFSSFTANAQTQTLGGQTSIGVKVTLKQYDSYKILPTWWTCAQDTVQQVITGEKYYVTASYPLAFYYPTVGNWIIWFIDLQAVSPSAPIQYLTWPSYYAKIAF